MKKLRAVPQPQPKAQPKGRMSMSSEDAESTYPFSEWMTPSSDSHGHSTKISTRCPPQYKHQIETILQSHKLPIETESDLVRTAVHRLLEQINKEGIIRDPEYSSQQAILNSLVEMSSREMEYSRYKATMEQLQATISELISNHAEPMARKLVAAVKEQVDRFEEDYWRDRYTSELITKYKHLLTKEHSQ